MKKMRKLLPAFAMLLVSAIMMSTASFAWFTMSAEVTAEGMTVKAQAAGGLVMSAAIGDNAANPTTNDYAANINFAADGNNWYTNGAENIFPTSTDGNYWYYASASDADSNEADADTYGVMKGGFKANSNYYLATKLYFKSISEGDSFELQVANITVSSSGSNLDNAIRVAMKVGEEWFFFAPNYDSDATGLKHTTATTVDESEDEITAEDYEAVEYDDDNLILGTDFDPVVISEALSDTTPVEVEVYIYYEGEDENCKSSLTIDLEELTISLDFSTNAGQ